MKNLTEYAEFVENASKDIFEKYKRVVPATIDVEIFSPNLVYKTREMQIGVILQYFKTDEKPREYLKMRGYTHINIIIPYTPDSEAVTEIIDRKMEKMWRLIPLLTEGLTTPEENGTIEDMITI